MVRRDGARVRCFTRNGHDWADRFPAIVEAAQRLVRAQSFLIDGEAVIVGKDGTPDFDALRSRSREAMLVAFDLLEHAGSDLRDLPLLERKRRLARLLGKAKRRAIRFNEHLTGDGATVFEHACRMGLEGIVSKRTDAPYQVEEPGERGAAPGARGGVERLMIRSRQSRDTPKNTDCRLGAG
jgi:ATP-dependent DNA ligase